MIDNEEVDGPSEPEKLLLEVQCTYNIHVDNNLFASLCVASLGGAVGRGKIFFSQKKIIH